jgi:molybdopterin/thiamine biosynthesis adenylyltransferase
MTTRFDRQIAFFGREGQEKLGRTRVAVVGVGGLGTHVVQQLALFGVGGLILIDDQELEDTNKNRYVGVFHDDPVPGSWKVDLGERLALSIDPTINVSKIRANFVTKSGFAGIRETTHVFGCLDRDGFRLILNEVCCAFAKPCFDLASEIIPGERIEFGGRVAFSTGGRGCVHCMNVLDLEEAQRDLGGEAAARTRQAIYGVDSAMLGGSGPSVASINGAIASLAVTEFMALVTGIRQPNRVLTYYGHRGIVTARSDVPSEACYYCTGIWGKPECANLERYFERQLKVQAAG